MLLNESNYIVAMVHLGCFLVPTLVGGLLRVQGSLLELVRSFEDGEYISVENLGQIGSLGRDGRRSDLGHRSATLAPAAFPSLPVLPSGGEATLFWFFRTLDSLTLRSVGVERRPCPSQIFAVEEHILCLLTSNRILHGLFVAVFPIVLLRSHLPSTFLADSTHSGKSKSDAGLVVVGGANFGSIDSDDKGVFRVNPEIGVLVAIKLPAIVVAIRRALERFLGQEVGEASAVVPTLEPFSMDHILLLCSCLEACGLEQLCQIHNRSTASGDSTKCHYLEIGAGIGLVIVVDASNEPTR
mmetsp:Transcript_21917/g.62861  ORF Transcript_21917/g.62861 Transcript_21917/m.62861 type:complete len:298 (-) Transcript_21917:1535-2428(-)